MLNEAWSLFFIYEISVRFPEVLEAFGGPEGCGGPGDSAKLLDGIKFAREKCHRNNTHMYFVFFLAILYFLPGRFFPIEPEKPRTM